MVAQLDDDSLTYVVDGDDPNNRSGGLRGCSLSLRGGSYDHKRQVQVHQDEKMREWDFLLVRENGSSIRLHPNWNDRKVKTYKREGHTTEVEPPARGLGQSDGPGTFKHYREIGNERTLRFDAQKRPQKQKPQKQK